MARELAAKGKTVCVIESGGFEETPEHEALNAVEASGSLNDPAIRQARQDWHSPQMRFWSAEGQRYGVRNRALGGSTVAWAGKVAPFADIDFATRAWVPGSGWPIGRADLAPYLTRAADHLALGPLLNDAAFWTERGMDRPEPVAAMTAFDSHFWQFARSRRVVTDVTRMGDDFRQEDLPGVTVLINATVARLFAAEGRVTGLECLSSLGGGQRAFVRAQRIVLASGAIENARVLLQSGFDRPGTATPAGLPAIGRYLMDHPTVRVGTVTGEGCAAAARLFGFFPLRQGYRISMYAHGLALRPGTQERHRLPNMAAFGSLELSPQDPIAACGRLARFKSRAVWSDLGIVMRNAGVIVSAVGRKLLESPRVPDRLKQAIADAAVWINADFVAQDYLAKGGSRKVDALHIELIAEQVADPTNRVTLSKVRDALGLQRANVRWELGEAVRVALLDGARLLIDDLARAGISGFEPTAVVRDGDTAALVARDMAHSAGTTRMGRDPRDSVVDADCQVHGVAGLFVAGASVFPTIGHANPTLMILAMAIRLADHIVTTPPPAAGTGEGLFFTREIDTSAEVWLVDQPERDTADEREEHAL